jgi:DHA2 family multidrug resistance protein
MLGRNARAQYGIIGTHVSGYDPSVRMLLDRIRNGFISRGMDFTAAGQAAYAALAGMVRQQATMVAFIQLFRLLSFVFAIVIPFVFIMRRPRTSQPPAAGH